MELKPSSPKLGGLSPPDCIDDPQAKEVSDEEDDDRNHKHRRRDTRSQSLETDSMDPVFRRPYRKHNKPFANGHPMRENEYQAGETWKNYNCLPLDKDLTSNFLRGRPRIRPNQTFSGDFGPGRGRGRDFSSWNQCDPRFSSVNIASQMVWPGSVAPSLFPGRGLPNVSNAHNSSWSAFGLMPGIPNGLDTLNPTSFRGVLRQPMNSSLNMGIHHQRCRDYEERGFCLRGDMCPMEHGINHIVVEDVQSLSQFNLPDTVPTAQLLATPSVPGPLPSGVPPSTSLMNSDGIHGKSSKPGMTGDAIGSNGVHTDSTGVNGADLYDPDQPLWNNNGSEATTSLSGLHSPKVHETGSLHDNELPIRSTGSQGTSLSDWGRVRGSRSRIDTKRKTNLTPLNYLQDETKGKQETFPCSQGTSHRVKQIRTQDDGSKMDLSLKSQNDSTCNSRKPTQKALRTLFVNGIPQKSNKSEALLSHFRKFGQVIEIYIPSNSERAFVQFSKREEAEAALKSPDAVMGNRFIKLWWANRDSVPDAVDSGTGIAVNPCGLTASVIQVQPVANREKDNLQSIGQKSNVVHGADVPSPNSPKLVNMNGPKAPPPLQKKLETLEQMKEELRKKQEMLEQKRNDFRRQLDKLQKQSSGVKGSLLSGQAPKRQKVEIVADPAKASTSSSSEPFVVTPCTVGMTDESKSTENDVSHKPTSSMQLSCVSAPVRHPVMMNKYKLDNRPISFWVIPPLPSGFADVDVLKLHFSQYGDLVSVELQDMEEDEVGSEASNNCSVLITYRARQSAEKAYANATCWNTHNLQFSWMTSCNHQHGHKETLSSAPE
ncbi:COPII coat assembly protein sec16-like [Hibiscus syriacus]|uniref:COPII coat assembly protein sec16-like n=1 Tax=Hibiscus syriacus TaxID=106335 RepID=A0A6A3ARZ4_HIBSY|nr:COPII coat assembly protein sec16-like [Hibiscus syriacus]